MGTTIPQCEAAACWLVLLAHNHITSANDKAVKRLRAVCGTTAFNSKVVDVNGRL